MGRTKKRFNLNPPGPFTAVIPNIFFLFYFNNLVLGKKILLIVNTIVFTIGTKIYWYSPRSNLTVFLKLCSRKTARLTQRIMSADKFCPGRFPRRMEAFVFAINVCYINNVTFLFLVSFFLLFWILSKQKLSFTSIYFNLKIGNFRISYFHAFTTDLTLQNFGMRTEQFLKLHARHRHWSRSFWWP